MKRGKTIVATILLAVAILLTGSPIATAAGTGPDDAVAPVTDWQPLDARESHWYAFQYAGDGSQIQVRLEVEPAESATFVVWTPEQIRRWGLGEYVEPIGRGSDDPSTGGGPLWSGNFNDAGTYYVVVEHAGDQLGTSYYLLTVSGDGVSLSTPTPEAPPTTPKPTQSRAKPDAASEPTGKLAFQRTLGGDIYTINADGTNLQRITSGMDPTWSPGGEQIAFTRWRDPRGVWVVDADGSSERRVFDWNEARWPSWSPDGSQILFSRQHGGRMEEKKRCFRGHCFTVPAKPHWKLGIVNPDDGTFREPSSADIAQAPAWAPDGAPGGGRIVYAGEHGLVIQSIDGGTFYEITHDARDTSPVWSPDGDQVAFVRRQHDHWEIYVVDTDGGNLTRLTDTPIRPDGTPGSSVSPAWSPSGQHVALLTDQTGRWEMWVMDADGSNQRPMFDTELDGLRSNTSLAVTLEYTFQGERAISWTR